MIYLGKYMNDPYSQGEQNFPIIGGKGGSIEIYSAIITHSNLSQGGNGGIADSYGTNIGRRAYVHGPSYGGDGGLVRTMATNLGMSTNTGKLKGGCGGHADIPNSHSKGSRAWVTDNNPSRPGRGGDVYANFGHISGQITGCTGSITRWDPTVLKATSTTRIEGSDQVVIFGGENWTMDLRDLSDGAISATETITIAVGQGGLVDLPDANRGKVFKAGSKVIIFADQIRLGGKLLTAEEAENALKVLAETPNVTVSPAKIIYRVEWSNAEHIVGEPGETIPVNLTLLNGGPTADSYEINITDSKVGIWRLNHLWSQSTVCAVAN